MTLATQCQVSDLEIKNSTLAAGSGTFYACLLMSLLESSLGKEATSGCYSPPIATRHLYHPHHLQ